jgi:hypothetical protein
LGWGLSQIVDGAWKGFGKIVAESGIGLRETGQRTFPRDPTGAARQRDQLGHGPAIDRDQKALAGLDATKHVGRVVAELADRDLSHGWSVAHEPRAQWRGLRRIGTEMHGKPLGHDRLWAASYPARYVPTA